jgi:hypothetical protein
MPLSRDVVGTDFETATTSAIAASQSTEGERVVESLFSDADGVRISAHQVGQGWSIVLADSSFVSNGRIGRRDNSVLATNLLAYALWRAQGDRATFDEYHFGYGRRETSWGIMAGLLLRTSPGWAVLCLTAAGLLFLLYKGRRFGTRRLPERQRRRSKLEYVEAVGATYKAAGAHRLTLKLILQWLRHRLAAPLGLSPASPVDQIASRLSEHTGKPRQRYQKILNECERAADANGLSARRAANLIEKLGTLETEILHERTRRK